MFGADRKLDPNKVAVYIRWSTDEQAQGTTLEVQREACEHYAKSQGWNYRPELVFVDDGYSGATLDRPSLGTLRETVNAGLIECVVVYKLDRLSRNLLDCVSLVRKEWGERCALYSTKENFDTKSPVGQMVFNILVSFAEFERNVIRDRTQSGKKKRAEQGRNAGTRYPFGYKKGDDGNWALDGWDDDRQCFTGRAAVIRRIFDQYLSGVSARTIAEQLRQDGIPSSRGGNWRYNTISTLLGNRFYTGRYSYATHSGGKRVGPVITVDAAAPAIVSQVEFDEVQRMRKRRAQQPPRALGSEYLLSGLAHCGKCGGTISGAGRPTSRGKRYYICTNRVFLKTCDCTYLDADQIEATLIDDVKQMISLDNLRPHVEHMETTLRQRIEECTFTRNQAEDSLATVQRRRKHLDAAFLDQGVDGRTYSRLSEALQAELEGLQRRLVRAEACLKAAQAATVDVDRLVLMANRVDAWRELTTEEMKQILRDIVGSLKVYQAKATGTACRNPNPIDIEWRPRLNLCMAPPTVAADPLQRVEATHDTAPG